MGAHENGDEKIDDSIADEEIDDEILYNNSTEDTDASDTNCTAIHGKSK